MKLIRDKVPDIIKKDGKVPITRKASDSEYYELLTKKLFEEAKEFSFDRNIEELVDILEVVYAIGKINHLTPEDLENKRKAKTEERGSFDKKTVWMGNEQIDKIM